MKNVKLEERIFADIDNEQIEFNDGCRGVGISKTDCVKNFKGENILLKDNDYIYLYMDIGEDGFGNIDYVFAEGHIIMHPDFPHKTPCKWCCKYVGDVLYMDEYQNYFK